MLKVARILVIAQALAGMVALLGGCGQKGPLVLPDTPAARGRATLPQVLNPWHKPASTNPAPADTSASEAASR